jgi:hypothetical protein
MIKSIKLKDALETDDGDRVLPGVYAVTHVCIQDGILEDDLFYLDGLDGICLSRMGLNILKSLGKIDFLQ